MALAVGFKREDNPTAWEFAQRLADLIDPGDMSQGRRDIVACDREALLGLAEEMDERAPYGWYSGERDSLRDYAHRIREALGVES